MFAPGSHYGVCGWLFEFHVIYQVGEKFEKVFTKSPHTDVSNVAIKRVGKQVHIGGLIDLVGVANGVRPKQTEARRKIPEESICKDIAVGHNKALTETRPEWIRPISTK